MLLPSAALFTPRFPSRVRQTLFSIIWTLSVTLLLHFSSGRTLAQTTEPTPPETEDADTIKTSTELLLFPIRIRDEKGRAVQGLTEKDLRVDDKDGVTSGLYFKSGVDRVALVFALDLSGSVRDVVAQQRDAALALFSRFGQRSSVAVLHFDETPKLVVPFNKDVSATGGGFTFYSGVNRRTAIFDAAAAAVQTFSTLPRVRSERQIVILISDGLDNASTVKPKQVIESAIQKRVSFYVIHLPLFEPRDGHLAVRTPSSGFKDLAEKTGGKYFLVTNPNPLAPGNNLDLTPIFQTIEEDLRSQYLVGFYIGESSRDGRKHMFSLKLLPPGIEFSVRSSSYSRQQKFFVHVPPKKTLQEILKRNNDE
jgi:VWFA-related protein